jgi:ADP-heptose:LPS heptosyltransferase
VIYGLAEVLVTNDGGPAHFAALTPIDVVTLFGPENHGFCCPHGSQPRVLGWHCVRPCVSV